MLKILPLALLAIALLSAGRAFAVDGQVLVNQAAVLAGGGFPYKITQPGSYKLSGNLALGVTGAPCGDAIDIQSDDVTLDLNGFTISCQSSAGFNGYGVSSIGFQDVTIANGSIRGPFNTGVYAWGGSGLISSIRVSFIGVVGIRAAGGGDPSVINGGWVVERCTAVNNNDGIAVTDATLVASVADSNRELGIYALASTVMNNVANNNGLYGIHAERSIFGGNTFVFNGTSDFDPTSTGQSQKNNACTSGTC